MVNGAEMSGGTVRQGAMWSAINTMVMKLATIGITAVVIRIVSPHEFGVFAVAATVYAVVSSFAELGLSSCLARADFDPADVGPTVAGLAMVSALALAAGTALGAAPLAQALGAPEAVGPIRVLSLSILLIGVFTPPTALLVRNFRQKTLFMSTVVAFVPSNMVLVVLAMNGDGAMAFAWSRVVGQAIAGLFLVWRVTPRFRPSIDRRWLGSTLRFGLPLAGANLVNYSMLNADYAFIGNRMGSELLGIYMLAFNVASWSTSILSASVNGVAMPAFSRANVDRSLLATALSSAVRLVCLIAFPVAALTWALARPLVLTLYGEKWGAAGPVLEVLAAYGALFIVSLVFSNLLVGTGRAARLLLIQGLWIGALLPAMAVGMDWDGLRGVALSHIVVLAGVVLPLYVLVAAGRVGGLATKLLRSAAAPLACACLAGIAARAVGSQFHTPVLALLVGGALGGVVYLGLAMGMLRQQLPERIDDALRPLFRPYEVLGRRVDRLLSRSAAPDIALPPRSADE